ncbi:MAG: lysophospholipid acyltransferase family protein [Lacinutrix sp.]|uniref:lysophospholipid acyltransferase family protein n=1 Tax=Lacinutrix sp. TaxID=1937692 RepID=UPI0030A1DF4A
MIVFKYIFWVLYRIWFYIMVALPIIIMFPLLILSILKESWYPYFFKLARIWARAILIGMGFNTKIIREQIPAQDKSYMFIANHTSMADIMLMLVTVKNPFVFVGKAELAKIPLFGFFYKRTAILVDRSNEKSRKEVFKSAQRRLKQGLSICIFPEGLVPEEEVLLADFKSGAFRLAINYQIPIVPITFADNKKLFSFTFFSGGPGRMRAKIHKFIETKDLTAKDSAVIKERSKALIYNQLIVFSSK